MKKKRTKSLWKVRDLIFKKEGGGKYRKNFKGLQRDVTV